MAEDPLRSEDPEGSKSKGWNKLRGKIFDKDSKLSKFRRHHDQPNSEQEVDDFLRPSTNAVSNPTSPAAPKLDISAAKSHVTATSNDDGFLDSTSARVGGEGGVPSYAPTREDMMSGKWTPHKPTRRPGLQVGFHDGPPDLIGEGGDESEETPLAIGQRQRRATGPSVTPSQSTRAQYKPPMPPSNEPPIPGRLRRTPTGFNEDTHGGHAHSAPEQYDGPLSSSSSQRIPRKASLPYSSQALPQNPGAQPYDEEEIIRPLRRAPTGFDEARRHQQQTADPSSDLHLTGPNLPPSSRTQQTTYEQQMQQILTNTYAQPHTGSREQSPMDRSEQSPIRRSGQSPGRRNEQSPTSSSDRLPMSRVPPRKQSNAVPVQQAAHLEQQPLSLRTSSRSPNKLALGQQPTREALAPELRSPVDSGSMRKMRAEEGLVHRSSVQGIQGVTGGDESVAAALAKISPGLDAPAPYSAQVRSSFDSVRSGESGESRYSHSPEPSSLPPNQRYSAASMDSGNLLSPPTSSHGHQHRPDPLQRQARGSQETLPPSFHEKPTSGETSVAYSSRDAQAEPPGRPPALNVKSGSTRQSPQPPAKDPNAEEAYTHFASAVSGTGSIFRLAAENSGVHVTLYDWTRCALWWFLKGREGIEEHTRFQTARRASAADQTHAPTADALRQHHLNLAKSYWMLTDIIPHLLNNAAADPKACPPSQSLSAVDAACGTLNETFKPLCLSMRRHDILPPPQEKFIQGLDSKIWLPQPFDRLPPDWQWVLSGKVFAPPRHTPDVEPMSAMPLQDTRTSFCYGRVFVSATVALGDDKPLMEPFESVLSFVRGKTSAEAEIVISSQFTDVNVHIRAAGEHGVHWEHTRFDHDERSLRIKLPQKLRLKLFCSQRDYKYLYNFFDNSQRISQSLVPKKNENLLQTMRLRSLHYRDSMHPEEFPSDPVGVCRAALFEQTIGSGRNPRKVHAGHRLAVVNLEKTVRNVNISFGKSAPFEYNISGSQPSLQFQLNEAGRRRSAHMVFEDVQSRDMFRDLLSGTVLGNNESVLCQLPITSLALSRAAATNLAPAVLRWKGLQVIDEDDPADPQHLSSSADASQNLRVMLYNRTGSVVDRMNDAVVDFKIRLEAAAAEQLQIYRGAERHDLTVAIGPDPAETNDLRQIFDVATSGPHVATYNFMTLNDLHVFQRAVTGFAVKYDGVASSFSIPRRKPGSVIAKHLESTEARVQILERERVIQLIAFFHDYILADSMNFELKATDRFDQTEHKSSGFGVKLVDAKFVLPGSGKDDPIKDGAVRDASAKFTAFDTEFYNQEHDDITISFKTEQERDRFAEALPAQVSLGKKFTLRRRI